MAQLHRYTAYALAALGLVHTLAARCYGELSADAIWFAGAGLALVFLALLNLAADASPPGRVWTICRAANVAGLFFAGPAAIAVNEPQGYVGFLLVAMLTTAAFLTRENSRGAEARIGTGVFILCGGAVAYQLVGCIIDGHTPLEIATWGAAVLLFAGGLWFSLRRSFSN